MTAYVRTVRPLPFGFSLATFLATSYLAFLALGLIVSDRSRHEPWLQFFPGFAWDWPGNFIGLVESIVYGFVAGLVFTPIYNVFNE